jgi:hypothetical protein
MVHMRTGTTSEWLSRLRLSRGAAGIAIFAILAHAMLSVGRTPAFAGSPGQGLTIVICTSAGITHVQVDANGQPIEQAPEQGAKHNHQCCPSGSMRPLVPPSNVVALLIPPASERAVVFAQQEERAPLSPVRTPQSPRGPPTSV